MKIYEIQDEVATVLCVDYHIAKALARTLVFLTDRPIPIRYGDQVIRTMGLHEASVVVPLYKMPPLIGSPLTAYSPPLLGRSLEPQTQHFPPAAPK